MSLSDLPDDILNLISIRLNGFDNRSLWMASDSKLRQRLVNNVITDFDIKYTIPGRYLWPGNFLKRLSKLSRLSLVVNTNVNHLPIENFKTHPIATLKYLKLDFGDSLKMFERKQLISTDNPTGPTTSSNNKYINLNDYYPNLEHLELISCVPECTLTIDFLGCLPQNLQTLLIPRNFIDNNTPNPTETLNFHLEMLPRTLTELHLTLNDLFAELPYLDSSKLPPNLTSLNMNLKLDENSYHMISKSFKKLKLKAPHIEKLAPFLPTGLESLEITIDEHIPTTRMFSRLENLEILSLRSTEPIQFEDFVTQCPPKLKNLSCNHVHLPDLVISNTLFNNCLTTLELQVISGIGSEFISFLPQSLTDLGLYQHDRQPFAYFSLLPRKLRSLVTNFAVLECTSLLPESLTCLGLSTMEPYDISCFDQLPPKLESLEVELKLPLSIIKRMPESLTYLSLVSDEFVDDETVRTLPKGLRHFSLNSQDKITDTGIVDLPPCLEILALYHNTNMTDLGILLLPRSLMSLTVSKNPNFTDECVKHLPRNLTFLSLNGATKITLNSCKDLPRYLQVLLLPECDEEMLIDSKNDLPQFLKIINFG